MSNLPLWMVTWWNMSMWSSLVLRFQITKPYNARNKLWILGMTRLTISFFLLDSNDVLLTISMPSTMMAWCLVILYVDELLITGSFETKMEQLHNNFKAAFAMIDLGLPRNQREPYFSARLVIFDKTIFRLSSFNNIQIKPPKFHLILPFLAIGITFSNISFITFVITSFPKIDMTNLKASSKKELCLWPKSLGV